MPYEDTVTWERRHGRSDRPGDRPDLVYKPVTRPRPAWHKQVYDLNLLGYTDGQIATMLGRKKCTVWKVRADLLKLPANRPPNGRACRPQTGQHPDDTNDTGATC